MASRIWHFLLPESGSHVLQVDGIGTLSQQVRFDGVLLPQRGPCLTFTGSSDSSESCDFELRLLDKKTERWALFVNDLMVEEYLEGKRTSMVGREECQDALRDLRNMPDGSYTIAVQFDSQNFSSVNVIRKFRFLTHDILHEVGVAHSEAIWQVVLDGHLAERRSHHWTDNNGMLDFDVPISSTSSPSPTFRDDMVRGRMEMEWSSREMKWVYFLRVNGVPIPCAWMKAKGDLPGVVPPQVCSGMASVEGRHTAPRVVVHPQSPPSRSTSSNPYEGREGPGANLLHDCAEPRADPHPEMQILPQGVSYDSETGTYQANIRNRAGKFVFLGEFETVEEAHQKYLEAVPIHSPEKKVAPHGVP